MNQHKELVNDIITITMVLRERHPEIYTHLGENPFKHQVDPIGPNTSDYREYLQTLISQLNRIETG